MLRRALLGAMLWACLVGNSAIAGPLSLQNALITGTYSAGTIDPTQPDGALDLANPGFPEFSATPADAFAGFAIDFDVDGAVLFYNFEENSGPFAPGSQVLTFSFAGISEAIIGFLLLDAGGVSGVAASAFSVLDPSTVQVDLSATLWTGYSAISAQLVFGPNATVPEPAAWLLIAMAMVATGVARRRQA